MHPKLSKAFVLHVSGAVGRLHHPTSMKLKWKQIILDFELVLKEMRLIIRIERNIALPRADILAFSSRFWLGSCFSVDIFCLNSSRRCDKTRRDVTYPRRYTEQVNKKGRLQIKSYQGLMLGFVF